MIKINNLNEMEKYYNEKHNTYVFNEDVEILFDLNIESNIDGFMIISEYNIKAKNIECFDMNVKNIEVNSLYGGNIIALNIKANDISYYGVCYAYNNIECHYIEGRLTNAKHFVTNGEIKIK